MRINRRPAFSASIRTSVAPASSAFSSSSFTTEEGRSTTSPAAILLATLSERMRMRPMSAAHRSQELGVATRLTELIEQQLHRLHGRKRIEHFAQHPDPVQFFARHQQLFFSRAALV